MICMLQFITATTSTTSYPGTQTTQTQEMEQPPAAVAKEPPATASKFREIRQPPTKRRNDQPEPAVEQDSVVIPGKTFLNQEQIREWAITDKLCEQVLLLRKTTEVIQVKNKNVDGETNSAAH